MIYIPIIIVLSIFFDQLTKWLILKYMYFNESIPIIQNIFHITYTRNKGAAFSLLNDLPPAIRAPFFVITGITFLIITAYYFRTAVKKSVIMRIGFSLVAGGALGNLIDRVRYGEVIDFIEVGISERYKWPVFNIADSCISIGIVMIIIYMIKNKEI